jgi:hypothetical protein
MKIRFVFLLLLVLAGVSACGVARHQELMVTQYPSYPENIKLAIDMHQILKGMTFDQVTLSLGSTSCKSSAFYQGSYLETWYYEPNLITGNPIGTAHCDYPMQLRVYFENGTVIGWETPK